MYNFSRRRKALIFALNAYCTAQLLKFFFILIDHMLSFLPNLKYNPPADNKSYYTI